MTSAAPTAASTPRSPSKALHIGLWVVQGLLAFAFLGAGFMKLTTPLDQLGQAMAWVTHTPGPLVRFIGGAEIAGALGLILPAATRIQPLLPPLAAAGLVTVMVLAAITHIAIGEPQMIAPNVVLGGLAAFVAWGRYRGAPIAAR